MTTETITALPARTRAEIAKTLRDLKTMSMSIDHQIDAIIQLTRETGGNVKLPQPRNTWDNQALEITLFGVFAQGDGWPDAIRNWCRAARTQVQAGGD